MNRKSKKCTLAVTASLAVAASAFGSHYVSNRKTSDTEPTVKRESVRTLTQRTGSVAAEAESMMSMRPETGLPGSPADPRHRLPAQGIMKLPEHNEDGVRIYYVVAQFWDNDNHDEKGAYYLDVDTDKTPHCYKVFDSSVFGPYISRGCTAVEDSFYALYQTSNSSPWWDYYVRYDINTWEYNDFWNDNVQISAFDICYDPWTDQTFGYSSYNYGKSTYSLASIDFEKKKKREIGPEIPYGERIIALAADMDYLYGFDNNADLYRINKTTGEKVLVGSTGLSMASRWESAVIDMRTRRLFLSATRYDRDAGKNYSCIWEINKETAAPTLIMDHGFDQQDIGLWSEELSTMSCPAIPENLSVEVEAGELSGNISFTAPLTLRDGSATSGSLTYAVIMNGRSVATGSTSCGEAVTVPFTVDGADSYKISAKVSNNAGPSRYARLESVIGYAKPATPVVTTTFDADDCPVVSWNPVTTSASGVEMESDKITYKVVRYPDLKVIADETTDTSVTDTDNLAEKYGIYYYGVTSRYSGITDSDETLGAGFFRGAADAPHEFFGFTQSTSAAFEVINGNGDDNMWKLDNAYDKERDYMSLWESYSSDPINNDDWLIAPPVRLSGGKFYRVEFNLNPTHNHDIEYEIKLGKGVSKEDLDISVDKGSVGAKDSWSWHGEFVKIEEDGVYRPALGITGPNGTGGVACKGYRISEAKDPGAPNKATNFTGRSNVDNARLLEISFNAPAINFDGLPLEKIDRLTVSRDGEEVLSYTNVQPGQAITCTSMVAETGREYTFKVVASNEYGDGWELTAPVYAGVRKSAPVPMASAWQSAPDKITVIWEAPATDEIGNPINPSDMTYTIYKTEGYVQNVIASGLTGLTYTFDYTPANPAEQEFVPFQISTTTEGGTSESTGVIPVAVGNSLPYPYTESCANGSVSNTLGIFTLTGNAKWALYRDSNFSDVTCQDGDGGMFGMNSNTRGDAALLLLPKISLKDAVDPVFSCYTYNISSDAGPDDNEVEILVNDGSGFKSLLSTTVTALGDADWNRIKTSLAAYKGKEVQIAIKGTVVTYTFVIIDNIRVMDNVTDNLAVASASCAEDAVAGEDFPVKVRIENLGDNTAENFTISLTRDDETVAEQIVDELTPGSGCDYTLVYKSSPLDSKRLTFRVLVDYDKDLVADDNESERFRVRFSTPTHPAVARLEGKLNAEGNPELTWDTPDMLSGGVVYETEDFSGSEPWSQTEAAGWTLLDKDGLPSGGMQDLILPGQVDDNGNALPMGFFVVDSSSSIFGASAPSWASYSGDRHLCSIYASGGANDDWAISPRLDGRKQTVSFYARSYSADYKETLRVMYSTSGMETTDFTEAVKLTDMSDEWTKYEVELPEGTTYMAFNCVSNDCFMLFIDCVTFSTGAAYELIGYNVYRNMAKANDEIITANSHVDLEAEAGDNTYVVTAVYKQGESGPSPEVYVSVSGIGSITDNTSVYVTTGEGAVIINNAAASEISVADVSGSIHYSGSATGTVCVSCDPGAYVVTVDGKSTKVIVK